MVGLYSASMVVAACELDMRFGPLLGNRNKLPIGTKYSPDNDSAAQ